jgi:archaellum biogenesis protein FlaJ (TadC family)
MEQFSIGLPMNIIILNILFIAVIFGAFIAVGFAIYRYIKGGLIIKVNNKLIEVNLFCKSLSSKDRPNSYVFKNISGHEVFEVSRKHYSYIISVPDTNKILSAEGNDLELKLNDPVKILHDSASEVMVTRLH